MNMLKKEIDDDIMAINEMEKIEVMAKANNEEAELIENLRFLREYLIAELGVYSAEYEDYNNTK